MKRTTRRLVALAAAIVLVSSAVLLWSAESTQNLIWKAHAATQIDVHYNDELQLDGDPENNLNFGRDAFLIFQDQVKKGEAEFDQNHPRESFLYWLVHKDKDGNLEGFFIDVINPADPNKFDGGILSALTVCLVQHFNGGFIPVEEARLPIGEMGNAMHVRMHEENGVEYAEELYRLDMAILKYAEFDLVELDNVVNMMFMLPDGLKGCMPALIVKSKEMHKDLALKIYWGEKDIPVFLRTKCLFQPVTGDWWVPVDPEPTEPTTPESTEPTTPEPTEPTTPEPTEPTTPEPTEPTTPELESKPPDGGPQGPYDPTDPTAPEYVGTQDPEEQSTEGTPQPTGAPEEYVPPTAPPPEETTEAPPPATTAEPTTEATTTTTEAPTETYSVEESTGVAEVETAPPYSESLEDVVDQSEATTESGVGGDNGECLPPE